MIWKGIILYACYFSFANKLQSLGFDCHYELYGGGGGAKS